MNNLHIDDFCKDVAKIFLLLFQRFPRTDILYIDEICGSEEPDEFGLHSKRHMASLSTVEWLHNANYLYYNEIIRQEAYDGAVLTHKAFTFLSSIEHNKDIYPEFYLDANNASTDTTLRQKTKSDRLLTRIDLRNL